MITNNDELTTRDRSKASLIRISWIWVITSLSVSMTGTIVYFLVTDIIRTEYNSYRVSDFILTWMPYAMLILATGFILSIIATVKVYKFIKIIPIIITLITALVFFLAWFAYAMSKP